MNSEFVCSETDKETENNSPDFTHDAVNRSYGSSLFGLYLSLYHSLYCYEGEEEWDTVYQETYENYGISDKCDDYEANSGW